MSTNDDNFWLNYFKVYDYLNFLIPYNDLIQTFIEKLDLKKDEIVLDVGSGTGNLLNKIKSNNIRLYGIDSSEIGIRITKRKVENAILIKSNLEESIPFNNDFFDKIYSNNTIYLIKKDKRRFVFDELYRVLKPGGKIVVSNIIEGFKPQYIYLNHITNNIRKYGLFNTTIDCIKLLIPTIKIFYYNYVIQRKNTTKSIAFFVKNEQRKLLQNSGFINISDNINVYSNQAILNFAFKPKHLNE